MHAHAGEWGLWCLRRMHWEQRRWVEFLRCFLTFPSPCRLSNSQHWHLCGGSHNKKKSQHFSLLPLGCALHQYTCCGVFFGAKSFNTLKCERRGPGENALQVLRHPIYCPLPAEQCSVPSSYPPLHTPHPVMCHFNYMGIKSAAPTQFFRRLATSYDIWINVWSIDKMSPSNVICQALNPAVSAESDDSSLIVTYISCFILEKSS